MSDEVVHVETDKDNPSYEDALAAFKRAIKQIKGQRIIEENKESTSNN